MANPVIVVKAGVFGNDVLQYIVDNEFTELLCRILIGSLLSMSYVAVCCPLVI